MTIDQLFDQRVGHHQNSDPQINSKKSLAETGFGVQPENREDTMNVQLDKNTQRPRHRRVTISDVSEALGITKSTVSRALNDYSDISEGTRLRVRRMADSMGYRPLSHAQAIRTGLVKSLGLVIQMADHDAQRPFLTEFLSGLSQGASAEGWTLTIAAANDPASTLETFQTLINDRKVDGFVLPRTQTEDPRIDLLRSTGVPFVLFGRSPDPTDCCWFDVLGEDAMRDAVHHLYNLGHRHIGFINGGMHYTYAPIREVGFIDAMTELGLTINPDHLRENAVTIEDGAKAALEILTGPGTPPSAIICAVDIAALGVYRTAESLGLTIGRDLSVISYDGIPEGAHIAPPLSTHSVDHTACGRRLAEILIQRIRGAAPETLRETTNATFLDRGSVGPPNT